MVLFSFLFFSPFCSFPLFCSSHADFLSITHADFLFILHSIRDVSFIRLSDVRPPSVHGPNTAKQPGFMNMVGVRSALHSALKTRGVDPESVDPWFVGGSFPLPAPHFHSSALANLPSTLLSTPGTSPRPRNALLSCALPSPEPRLPPFPSQPARSILVPHPSHPPVSQAGSKPLPGRSLPPCRTKRRARRWCGRWKAG